MTVEAALKVAAAVLQALAIIVTAYFASRGLHTWRHQLLGKRRMEVAEEALVAAYKMRDDIHYIRYSMPLSGEGKMRPRQPGESELQAQLKDRYFVPLERAQTVRDDFAQFLKARVLCEAVFGPDTGRPFQKIIDVHMHVIHSAEMLVARVGGDEFTALRPGLEADIWESQDLDVKARIVSDAVGEIEQFTRAHLRDNGNDRLSP